jgi:hypothetical protein
MIFCASAFMARLQQLAAGDALSLYSETCEQEPCEIRTSCEIRTPHLVPKCCFQSKLHSEMRTPLIKRHFLLVPRVFHKVHCITGFRYAQELLTLYPPIVHYHHENFVCVVLPNSFNALILTVPVCSVFILVLQWHAIKLILNCDSALISLLHLLEILLYCSSIVHWLTYFICLRYCSTAPL